MAKETQIAGSTKPEKPWKYDTPTEANIYEVKLGDKTFEQQFVTTPAYTGWIGIPPDAWREK